MKIGILIDRLRIGGVEKTAIAEVKALREAGFDASLLVLKRDATVSPALTEWLSGIDPVYLDDRLRSAWRVGWRMPGFYFFSFFHLLYAMLLPRRVHAAEWDVVVAHNSFTALSARSISRSRAAIPYCMFVWDPIDSVLSRAYSHGPVSIVRPVLQPLGRAFDRLLARGARRVIAGSRSYVGYISGLLPPGATVVVAPPGCVPAESPRAAAGDYVLAATSWKEGKQLEVLLHALARLPAARLVVAGRWLHEGYRQRVLGLTKELGLEDRVTFLGERDEEGMTAAARGALCSVTLNAELGFGMPALEAAAQACTFVCPRVSGVAAYFEDGVEAFYFDEGDAADLASVLARLIDDRDLATRAGRAAWEKARAGLTWRHHAALIASAAQAASPAPAQERAHERA